MASHDPFTFNLKASNDSLIQGCPGVQRSFPRIQGTVELRSNNGIAVLIRRITLSLVNVQDISVPSSSGIGSNMVSRSFNLFNTGVYAGSEEILGLDVPFVVPINTDIIASSEIPKYSMVNKTVLKFVIVYGNKIVAESVYEFPISVKKYNTLPIYRQFMNSGTKVVDSPDRLVLLEYSMPRICVGPGDDIELLIKISLPTLHNKKVKLKRLQLDLREIIEFHDGGFQERVSKLAITQKDFNGERIVGEGIKLQLNLKFPDSTPWNEMTSTLDTDTNSGLKSTKLLRKINPSVPLSHQQGFTVVGKFFSVRYELVLKVKFSHAKDMDVRQQLIVSPFDTRTSIEVLKWIMEECELASDMFGPNFLANSDATLKRAYHLSGNRLAIYKANSVDDWVKLGLGERLVKSHGKVLDYYLD